VTSAAGPTGLTIPVDEGVADAARRRGLRRMKALALSLLVLAALIYLATRDRDGFLGYVNAGTEAAMVGAIADWFAVTALFRHPMGVPIPHTAIIPKRKESLGASLQEFVAENFLREDVVRERIATTKVAARAGGWLVEGDHAHRLVDIGSRMLADGLGRVKQSDVAAVVEEAIIPRMLDEPLGPVAGQLLDEIVRDGAHGSAVDLVLTELHRWLSANEDEITFLVGQRAPWWTPIWLDERVAARIHAEAVEWVAEIRDTPNHQARQALDKWLTKLADDLQHDAGTQERAERLKHRLLTQPQVAATAVAVWDALRRALAGSLEDPDGLVRRRALEELLSLGSRLMTDEALGERVDDVLADVAAYVVDHYGRDLATIISATVNRWDGKETAERIELHVGRDLQFIRINGTVVGGLAGLAIHAVSSVL
jgi:uncharacterized membrane-anchored protein YjiN (DUF445 family)